MIFKEQANKQALESFKVKPTRGDKTEDKFLFQSLLPLDYLRRRMFCHK